MQKSIPTTQGQKVPAIPPHAERHGGCFFSHMERQPPYLPLREKNLIFHFHKTTMHKNGIQKFAVCERCMMRGVRMAPAIKKHPPPGAAVHHAKTGSTMCSAADTPHRGKHTPRPKTPRKNAAHTATPHAHKHLIPPRSTPHPHTMQHTPTIVNRPFLSPHGEAPPPPPRSEPNSGFCPAL